MGCVYKQTMEPTMSENAIVESIKIVFALFAVIALGFVVVRPMLRMLREKPDVDFVVPDYFQMTPEDEELEIPQGGAPGEPTRAQKLDMVKQDPQATAMMVQNWLRSKK